MLKNLCLLVTILGCWSFKYDYPDSARDMLNRNRRIVGGYLTKVSKVPFIVNLRRRGAFHCGGVLISSKCILTAAHCVGQYEAQDFTIQAGATYLRDLKNQRKVSQIVIPSSYNKKHLDHDIAIMVLKEDFIFKKNFIETIDLAREMPRTYQMIQISGWGFVRDTAQFPSFQLRSANVRISDTNICRQVYSKYRNVTENMFCAFVPGARDSCFADSGGPAVSNNQLVGIISWGPSKHCAGIDTPGVYANIPKLSEWIKTNVVKYC